MTLIEITAEQADQFRAAGVMVRYAIVPTDLSPAPPKVIHRHDVIDVTPKVVTRKRAIGTTTFTQQFRKGTVVRLAPDWEKQAQKIPEDSKRYDIYVAVGLLLSENGKMLRHNLWHATQKLLGKQYTSVSSSLTDMLREGFLIKG